MIKKLDLNEMNTLKQIIELQWKSYRVEAGLIGFEDIPPLRDTEDTLSSCGETFYGYSIDRALVGIVSYKIIENILDVHRVAVDPSFFRRGIAEKLLNFIEDLEENVDKIVVSTGKMNHPAVNLYLKKGYGRVRDIEIAKGVYITEFEKTI